LRFRSLQHLQLPRVTAIFWLWGKPSENPQKQPEKHVRLYNYRGESIIRQILLYPIRDIFGISFTCSFPAMMNRKISMFSLTLPLVGLAYVRGATASNASWIRDGNGNWSDAANWNAAVPNATDSTATFGPTITAARTVNVDAPQTVGSINFSSLVHYTLAGPGTITLSTSAGHASINDTLGSPGISAPLSLASDTMISSAGDLRITGPVSANNHAITTQGAGTVDFSNVRAKALVISSGVATVLPDNTFTGAGASSVGTLSLAFGSGMDLANNDLQVTSGDFTVIKLLIDSGNRGLGGVPNSPAGLFSSTSRADPTHVLTLGELTGAQYKSFGNRTTFDGFTVNDTDTLVKFTIVGDSNFDGTVNALDFNAVAANFAMFNRTWATGDFNNDGFVNTLDFAALARGFGQTVGLPSAAPPFSLVPEPNWVGVLACVAIMMIVKRKRRFLI
jgi:hypothetical protein